MKTRFEKVLYALYGTLLTCASMQTNAAIPLAQSPLFLETQVPPNLIVTLDDSGSMARAYVPDTCGDTGFDCSQLDNRYIQSSHYNKLFYDPTIKYLPGKNAAGAPFSTTTFANAWRNGYDPRTTAQGGLGARNLASQYRATAHLDFPVDTSAGTESYMKPYSTDLRCNSGRCELSKGNGNWWTSTKTCSGNNHDQCRDGGTHFDLPAYYYQYVGSGTGCSGSASARAEDNDCYRIRIVAETAGTADYDGNGTVDTEDQKYNFANWYSFARTRHLATQTAITQSFANINPEMRVAWQALNSCHGGSNLPTTSCRGWEKTNPATALNNAIKPFSSTHKANFFKWVSRLPTASTTPLPAAMKRAGDYLTVTGENGPYDNDLTQVNSGSLSCRRNYHVMMTDGMWSQAVAVSDLDSTSKTLPDAKPYTARAPYSDYHSPTLADLAFRYWSSDLVGLNNDLKQDITKPNADDKDAEYWDAENNPATWQHMVNFTIGLGLGTYMDEVGFTWDSTVGTFGGSYTNVKNGSLQWPDAGSYKSENVTDLWHAAINSRGQFFSADSATQLSDAFTAAIAAIGKDKGSSAALSANSTSLKTGALLFQAKFTEGWSGTLLAFNLGARGKVDITKPVWNAAEELPAPAQRLILTHNGTQGVLFETCGALHSTQATALNTNLAGNVDNLCLQRMNWLRGATALEKSKYNATTNPGAIFRDRPTATGTGGVSFTNVMGDIINSDPAYVKDTDFGYGKLSASSNTTLKAAGDSYGAFVSANGNRKGMVYVGANDGRMYGIETGEVGESQLTNANMGRERFAYIPAAVYSNLSNLTDPAYSHRYYADGSVQFGDAYLGGAWKTIVVAGLNAGGRAVYALDVTNPNLFNASTAATKAAATSAVLWEYGPNKDPDGPTFLGSTYSRPQIGILEDGKWVAVFGNGYNSPSGGAYLYIVDLATGVHLRRALAEDASGDESNGLSTPVLYDSDNNGLIDTAFAGDLLGSVWKFDLKSSTTNPDAKRVFRATDKDNNSQPITAKPKIAQHPQGGPLLLFGTGRYLTAGDVTSQSTQTFYGIWADSKFSSTTNRANLQAQEFDYQDTNVNAAGTVRSVTSNTVNWGGGLRGWYLDLLDEQADGNGQAKGERIIHAAHVQESAVIFGSVVPSADPCTPGGSSFLYALSLETGGSMNQIVFDTDDDGVFDDKDMKDPPPGHDRSSVLIGGVSFANFGLTNIATLIQGSEENGDGDVTYAELASTNDMLFSQGMCLKAGGCGKKEEEEEPPVETELRKRSWIQIR
jgi:type IV pilus assembly protein PilY1